MTLEKQIAEDYGMVLKEAQSMGCNKINALYNIPLDNMKAIVNALEEVEQYREIGTPAECRLAVEKQKAKKPKEYEDKFYARATCGNVLLHKWEKYHTKLMDKKNGLPYCLGCGQKLDWSDEE